jgi:hypothetical protein
MIPLLGLYITVEDKLLGLELLLILNESSLTPNKMRADSFVEYGFIKRLSAWKVAYVISVKPSKIIIRAIIAQYLFLIPKIKSQK